MGISIKRLGWNGISTSKDPTLNYITILESWGLEKCNEFINMYEKVPREIIIQKIRDIKKKWINNYYEIHPSVRSKWKSLNGDKDPVEQGFFILKVENGSNHPLVIAMIE